MRAALLLLLVLAGPAFAQSEGIQKELMRRQQATDAFNLQLQQSQDAVRAAPADRRALETRQLSDRQRLDNVSEQQLRDVRMDGHIQPELRPYERQKADAERIPFRSPVMEAPVRPAPKPAPILPPEEGIRLEPAR